MYEIISQDPERARRFGSSMKAFTKGTGYSPKYVAEGFPWSDLGAGTVVDVSCSTTVQHPALLPALFLASLTNS